MSDEPLLPSGMDGARRGKAVDPEAWEQRRREKAEQGISLHRPLDVEAARLAATQPGALKTGDSTGRRPTSACSPASEDSTSPSSDTGSDASDRSSGTEPVRRSSRDTGRRSRDGATSPDSLLPTPTTDEATHPDRDYGSFASLTREARALAADQASLLLPTPNLAHLTRNDDEEPEAFLARRASQPWSGGVPLPVAIKAAQQGLDLSESTSSSEDSPASPHRPPASGREPTTTAGYGLSSPALLASYDPDSSSWRTFQGSLLSTEAERFPRSWERWPTSGMTRRGRAYALRRSARPTDASGSSSSRELPTPVTMDARDPNRREVVEAKAAGQTAYGLELRDAIEGLLPTPTTDDAANVTRASGEFQSLTREARLLSSPTASDATSGGAPSRRASIQADVLNASSGDPTPPRSEGGKS